MIPTYSIGANGRNIVCLDCGMTSWNINDVKMRYCGNCHEFHDNKELKARVHEHFDKTPAEEVVANAEEIARQQHARIHTKHGNRTGKEHTKNDERDQE